jgi:hypothetical protein
MLAYYLFRTTHFESKNGENDVNALFISFIFCDVLSFAKCKKAKYGTLKLNFRYESVTCLSEFRSNKNDRYSANLVSFGDILKSAL